MTFLPQPCGIDNLNDPFAPPPPPAQQISAYTSSGLMWRMSPPPAQERGRPPEAPQKVCVPQPGLIFRALLINFFFLS